MNLLFTSISLYSQTAIDKGSNEYNIGCAFYERKQYDSAFVYLKRCADFNYLPGVKKLAKCYLHGFGCIQNDSIAISLYEKSFSLGDDMSSICLYNMNIKRNNCEKAKMWLQQGCNRNITKAMNILAIHYYNGSCNFTKNDSLAFMWLKKSSDLNDSIAQYALYKMLKDNKENNKNAYSFLAKSADNNYSLAQYEYGFILIFELKDVVKGWRYMYKSAKNGNVNAKAFIGCHRLKNGELKCTHKHLQTFLGDHVLYN